MQTQILGLLAPLMALFFAATFAVLWRVGRLKRYVLGFGIAYILSASGFLITHLLPADSGQSTECSLSDCGFHAGVIACSGTSFLRQADFAWCAT